MKRELLGVALVVAGAVLVGCGTEAPRPEPNGAGELPLTQIRIGYQPTVFYSYLFLAEELGLFEEAGFDAELVRIPSANEMFQAFLSGQLDMTGLTATEVLLRGHERSPDSFYLPLMVELGPDHVADRILVLETSPITSIQDLAGKRIGSHPGTTVPNIMRAVLAHHGIAPEQVEIQTLKPDLQVEALLSGAVDAIICLEPCGTELLVTGRVRELMSHPFGVVLQDFPASFAALSSEFVHRDAGAAERLIEVIESSVRAYRERAASNPESLAGISEKYLDTRPEVARRLSPVVYRLPSEWQESNLSAVVGFYVDVEIITSPIDLMQLAIPRRERRQAA